MKTEIVAALIGVTGVLIAALIAAFTSIYSRKESEHHVKDGNDNSNEETGQATDESSNLKYVGNLVDFVEGASEESPLKVEIAVNEDGRIILFYTHTLKVHLKRMEYYSPESRLVFVSDSDQIRYLGLPLSEDVAKHLNDVDKILLIKFDEKTKNMSETGTLPFKIYS